MVTFISPPGSSRRGSLKSVRCCSVSYNHEDSCVDPIDTSPTIMVEQTKPFISGFTGQSLPTVENPFNSFRISKPGCCELTVVTDHGSFPMPSTTTEFSSCDYFTDIVFNSIELQGSDECIETTTVYISGQIVEMVEVENPNAEPCVPLTILTPSNHGYDPCDC